MAAEIPYRQLSTLVAFLKATLRSDPVLLEYFEGPDDIITETLEHDPLAPDPDDGRPKLFRQELPVLAVWEQSSARIRASAARRQGLHKCWGEEVDVRLIYAHKVYHGSESLTPEDVGARMSKLVQWQLREHIERHKFDGLDEPFDLLTDGKIESIEMLGVNRLPPNQYLDGFAADLKMVHYSAPYDEVAPLALQLIKLELHLDDVVPAVDGPIIYGDIDVTS